MKSPSEMEEQVDTYAFYMFLGLLAVLIVTIILLAGYFLFNVLSLISMG